jgi:hypothetical protein
MVERTLAGETQVPPAEFYEADLKPAFFSKTSLLSQLHTIEVVSFHIP